MNYPFGQAVRITLGPITNDAGLADPDTLDLTFLLPDASSTVLHKADLTHVSTGLFHYDYLPPEAGTYGWRGVGTVPNVADEGQFTVETPFAALDLWCSPSDIQAAAGMASLTDSDALTAAQMATDILNALSGRQFGVRTGTVRPAGCGHHGDWLEVDQNVVGWGLALPVAAYVGPWPLPGPSGGLIMECGGCSRWSLGSIDLEGKVVWDTTHPITVEVDGATLDPANWALVDGRRLIRLDGGVFIQCQDLRVATTEVGTLAITYSRGVRVPMGGVQAAITLAGQLAISSGMIPGECQLPERVTTITRQGVAIGIAIDPLTVIREGGTGITSIDLFIASVNPHGLRRRASIHTPGMESPQPVVVSGSAAGFG